MKQLQVYDYELYENKFKRMKNTDILGVYYGMDSMRRPSVLIKLQKKPIIEDEIKFMDTNIAQRRDGKWALIISLTNQDLFGVFQKFIDDLVETISGENVLLAAERRLVQRYYEWRILFEQQSQKHLDFTEIQGLFGELFFIKNFLFDKYGVSKTISAWVGPMGADKDFMFHNIWYEVKTKALNKDTIHVNSKTQLTSAEEGCLVIISCEKSSPEPLRSFNLMELYFDIINIIPDDKSKADFQKKLALIDFVPNDFYTGQNFLFHEITYYKVSNSFPSIPINIIDKAITNIEYDLYIPNLKNCRLEE